MTTHHNLGQNTSRALTQMQPDRAPKRVKRAEEPDHQEPESDADSEEEGDILATVQVSTIPSSIDDIVSLMDELLEDHGQAPQHYYCRQEDSRKGCSNSRGKLRKFAKANPDHPAVAHWIQTNQWEPPNQQARDLMILIRDMIDTSWPL